MPETDKSSHLFKNYHLREVPARFLPEGATKVRLRFCQLNKRKMAKAEQNHTYEVISNAQRVSGLVSQEAREAQIRRQENAPFPEPDADAKPDVNTFDDYADMTLIMLAHVEHHDGNVWVELTEEEIEELVCDDWLAGEIYDASRPSSAKEREKNS